MRAPEPAVACPSDRQKMEAAWAQRAKRLSRRSVLAAAGQNALPVIVLGIGKERYGIDLSDVTEVLAPVLATPVPGAAAFFSGVINVHGEIRPVIELRRLLGIQTAGGANLPHVILLRKDGGEIGLQIDSVEQIRWVGSADLQKNGNNDAAQSRYVRGTTKDLLMLLNTQSLFAELHEGVPT